MQRTGLNLSNLKKANRNGILHVLNEKGDMSRKDLAQLLGLTPAAVTQICSELISEGYIVEQGEFDESRHVGRKKIRIGINKEYGNCLAANVTDGKSLAVLCSMDHTPVESATCTRGRGEAFQSYLARVADSAAGLAKKSSRKVVGVGMTFPDGINPRTGRVTMVIDGAKQSANVKSLFEDKLGIPVSVESYYHGSVLAEILLGHGNAFDNLLLVHVDDKQLASAITVRRRVYENMSGKHCDVGSLIVADGNGNPVTLEKLFLDACAAGGEKLMAAEKLVAEKIARIAIVACPDRIIISGKYAGDPVLAETFREAYPYDMENLIIRSNLVEQKDYIGAFALAYEHFLNS